MRFAVISDASSAWRKVPRRASTLRVVLGLASMLLVLLPRPGRSAEEGPIDAAIVGDIQHDQFVAPELFCEYQVVRLTTGPERVTTPPFSPQLISRFPVIPWKNIVRVHVDCWVPKRSWSSLRHLLGGRYHDRLFGMISSSYLVEHLRTSGAGSLDDPRVLKYLIDRYSSRPENGQKPVPGKISDEVKLGIGAELIARSLRESGSTTLQAERLPALWKRVAPELPAPVWSRSTLTQLELLTREAIAAASPFWRAPSEIGEGDSFLLQRYAFYRGPSSAIRPRPLTQAWDLLHVRSVTHPCNDLSAGPESMDRSGCAPSTLMWEKIAGQSKIQHTLITARYARHNGVEGTQATMDWVWDFSYVMLPFNLTVVKDTIRAYFRSLIRGFYTLPREE